MSGQALAARPLAPRLRGGRVVLDALVLVFTLVCGIWATWYASSAADATRLRQRQEQFNAAGQSVVDSFYLDLVRAVEAVRATGLMVANQQALKRSEFERFAQGIMANAPTLSSLQWQPVVPGGALAAFEAQAQGQGLADYRVVSMQGGKPVPAQPKAEHVPILYAFPDHSAPLGLDLSDVPQRMESKRLARLTGQPVASPTFALITGQDGVPQTEGVVISSAVVGSQRVFAVGDEALTQGYVAGVIPVKTLFSEAAFRAEAASLDIMVFDQAVEPRKLVFSTFVDPERLALALRDVPQASAFDVRLTVDLASRPWEVVLRPRPHMLGDARAWDSQLLLWGGSGATLLLVLTMFITQRSRRVTAHLQQKSQLAEQRLGHILDGTQAGTWEWHVPSGKRLTNERWATMLGYTHAELDGTDNAGWLRLLNPADRALTEQRMQAHFCGETPNYECELRVRHKQGHWVWILSRAAIVSRMPDGQPQWVAGTHLDISASKRLVQQMADVRTALDAHAIVGITDANGSITFANDKFCAVSQYSRAELMGHDHSLLNSGLHPKAFFDEMWDTITQGRTWRGEIRNRAKDGHFYWVDTTIAPILDEAGLPEQYIAIRYDITDKIHSATSLQAAKDAAEAASRAKSEFLATMSHEIRTPMNGTLGMLKLLQHTELSVRQLDYTRKAEGATQALLGIINDILDFSKIEAGKLDIDHAAFVLGDVLRDLSVILSASLGHKDVEVLFAVAPDVPQQLLGDALRLHQVLLNLCGNAIKFTEHGHVLVRLRRALADAGHAAIEFSVQDSGIGIANDKLDYIFEGFSQAESTTTRRFGGSGLGLAISKRLVAAMGGDLQVQSQLGQGSRFFFTLRFDLPPPADHNALAQAPLRKGDPTLRVLVVDDSALARDVLSTMVTSMGWDCACLDSGEAALAHLGDASAPAYDLVLMDWRMPGLDGWETTRRIRQLQTGGQAPVVIMVTAAGREALAAKPQAEAALLDGYLVKPVTASMVFDAVTEATAARRGLPEGVARPPHLGDSLQRLHGLRLLVVEDNLLNQQIAQELLQRHGAVVEIATGGIDGVAQALDAQPPFDAILMDIQMPDIDGLEATRRIRSVERLRAVPIIAMTANAMPADKDACLAVGMVDHVGKPIDVAVLIGTLLRHTTQTMRPSAEGAPAIAADAPSAQRAQEMKPAPQDASTSKPCIDLDAAVQRLGGNRAFFDKVAKAYRGDAAAHLVALPQQLAQADKPGALRSIHTFKGLAATVGANDLARQAAQTEQALKGLDLSRTEDVESFLPRLTPLQEEFSRVLDELAAICQPAQSTMPESAQTAASQPAASTPLVPTPTPVADSRAFAEQLRALGELLRTGNMRASLLCSEMRQAFAGQPDADFEALAQAVNRLDFAQAEARCEAMLDALSSMKN